MLLLTKTTLLQKHSSLHAYTSHEINKTNSPPTHTQTTDIKFKGKEAPVEKSQPSVLKRYGSPDPSATAVLVPLDDGSTEHPTYVYMY